LTKKANIVILGSGESGVGAALLAQQKQYNVFVSDAGAIKENYKALLKNNSIPYEETKHNEEMILQADLIIKSPGIPESAPLIKKLRAAKKEIISEIEFASRYCTGKIVAITGSNGKTTTSLLTYHILKSAGLKVALGGNIGKSFAGLLTEDSYDYYVIEVSSFQLDDINSFKPHIAILLNITPDHLDRYDYKMENYVKSKFSITKYQTAEDFFLWNEDDEESKSYLRNNETQAHKLGLSIEQPIENGAWADTQNTIYLNDKNQEQMTINELALQGKHNTYNSMASGLASKLLGIRKEVIRESLANFESVEHRLETVIQVYGIKFINDSKATNVNSTWYALESMQRPTIWVVGGVDKGNDYSQLYDLVSDKVKAIVCLGEDNTKLHKEFEDKVPFMIDAASMDEAVRISYKLGDKGDTVLLSPACASFDFFENYEDRGRQFKEAVRQL
jgi:UDP-N-acetylmuramoylalanine--D-glutamate ligase